MHQSLDVSSKLIALGKCRSQPAQLPLAYLIDVGNEAVVDPVASPSRFHHTGIAKNSELARRVRLRKAQGCFKVADAQLTMREQRHDAQASHISQRLEQTRGGMDIQFSSGRAHSNITIHEYRDASTAF